MPIVNHIFLGREVRGGVSTTMRNALIAIENQLRTISGAQNDADFFDWCRIREPHIGFRSGQGLHGSGSAIDINVTTNLYIATRTGTTFGGEAGTPNAQAVRQAAVDVFDRAAQFQFSETDSANVSIRVNDTIE